MRVQTRFAVWTSVGAALIAAALLGKTHLDSYEPQEYTGPVLSPPTHVARVGDAPDALTLHDLEGRTIALGGPAPRKRLIHFWASWCLPCVAELPSLEAERAHFDAAHIDLVTVALDDREHAAEIVARDHLTIPVLLSDGAAVDPVIALGSGQGVVPFNVLLDTRGIVLRQTMGTVEGGGAGMLRWANGN